MFYLAQKIGGARIDSPSQKRISLRNEGKYRSIIVLVSRTSTLSIEKRLNKKIQDTQEIKLQ